MNKQPIGFFDSGVGGLSIWQEVTSLLPQEDTIYLADSLNAPYGEKGTDEIIKLCVKNTDKLIELGCKIIIVACNTATTNAISFLRNKYSIPFIGIEPAIKPASVQTKSKNIGILATKGTLNSKLFEETSNKYLEGITVIETIATGLVTLIENDQIESEEMSILLDRYISPMLTKKIDCLVLGCSHYPFLIKKIRAKLGTKVKIIDSGLAVAKQTKNILDNKQIANNEVDYQGRHLIYSNTQIQTIKKLIKHGTRNTTIIKETF